MITRVLILLAGAFLFSPAHSADSCAVGEKQLHTGEPCISTAIFNYLYCLEKSGLGRTEITSNDSVDDTKKTVIRLEGKGSGIIIKGEGGGDYTSDESHKAIKALSQKIDPTLAEKCQQMADTADNPRPKRPTVNVISAIDTTLEDDRESFLVEAKTTYSGDHGEDVVLEICMIQPGQEQCGTSRHQVKIGEDDVTKMRMRLHTGGYLGSNWDLLKPIEFKACFHVKDNTSFFGDCKKYVRRPGDLKMDAFSDD